jgi:hypothetical protein
MALARYSGQRMVRRVEEFAHLQERELQVGG